jgi:hypothetical protein
LQSFGVVVVVDKSSRDFARLRQDWGSRQVLDPRAHLQFARGAGVVIARARR